MIALTSGSGTVIARYSYDPYGLPRASTETNPLAAHNIHRYHGGLLDKTTGLTRYGVRWYNPATGRFTTPDPSGQEQNPYLYAAANPCNNNDKSGESCEDVVAVGGLVGGGVVTLLTDGIGAPVAYQIGAGITTGALFIAAGKSCGWTGSGSFTYWQDLGGTHCQVNPSTGARWCH